MLEVCAPHTTPDHGTLPEILTNPASYPAAPVISFFREANNQQVRTQNDSSQDQEDTALLLQLRREARAMSSITHNTPEKITSPSQFQHRFIRCIPTKTTLP